MKVAVGLRRVAAGKRTSGRRAAQIAIIENVEIRNVSKAIPIVGNDVGNLYCKEYVQ